MQGGKGVVSVDGAGGRIEMKRGAWLCAPAATRLNADRYAKMPRGLRERGASVTSISSTRFMKLTTR